MHIKYIQGNKLNQDRIHETANESQFLQMKKSNQDFGTLTKVIVKQTYNNTN